jgi:hypothetical protein
LLSSQNNHKNNVYTSATYCNGVLFQPLTATKQICLSERAGTHADEAGEQRRQTRNGSISITELELMLLLLVAALLLSRMIVELLAPG